MPRPPNAALEMLGLIMKNHPTGLEKSIFGAIVGHWVLGLKVPPDDVRKLLDELLKELERIDVSKLESAADVFQKSIDLAVDKTPT